MDIDIYELVASITVLVIAIFLIVIKYRKDTYPKPDFFRKKGVLQDRRLFDRKKTSLRIKYRTGAGEGVAWLTDINQYGARLLLANPVEAGTPVTIEITLPYDRRPLFAEGHIAWVGKDETGFRIEKAKEEDLTRIIQYTHDRAKLGNRKSPPGNRTT